MEKCCLRWKNAADKLSQNGVEWKRIPPFSPEKVGSWERLVGLSKNLILSILSKNFFRKISGEELLTYFKEVQGILNH